MDGQPDSIRKLIQPKRNVRQEYYDIPEQKLRNIVTLMVTVTRPEMVLSTSARGQAGTEAAARQKAELLKRVGMELMYLSKHGIS